MRAVSKGTTSSDKTHLLVLVLPPIAAADSVVHPQTLTAESVQAAGPNAVAGFAAHFGLVHQTDYFQLAVSVVAYSVRIS